MKICTKGTGGLDHRTEPDHGILMPEKVVVILWAVKVGVGLGTVLCLHYLARSGLVFESLRSKGRMKGGQDLIACLLPLDCKLQENKGFCLLWYL